MKQNRIGIKVSAIFTPKLPSHEENNVSWHGLLQFNMYCSGFEALFKINNGRSLLTPFRNALQIVNRKRILLQLGK